MESLGAVLARMRRGSRGEPLEYLVELEPTADIEHALDAARERLGWALMRQASALEALAAGEPGAVLVRSRPVAQADAEIERCLDLVRQGRRRDLLTLAHGCWCLGLGGRRWRPVYRPGLGILSDAEGGTLEVCDEYCVCPIGTALEVEHEHRTTQAVALASEARIGRMWHSVPIALRNVTLESYELAVDDPRQLAALREVRAWVPHRSRWMVLTGPAGVGKSGLAIAAARETGQAWTFVLVEDLLDAIRATFDHDRQSRDAVREGDVLARVYDAELLIVDDLGTHPATDWAASEVFKVIYHREAQQRRTIITTNLAAVGIEASLGPQGERVLSRIVGAADPFIVSVQGRDLRQRKEAF